MCTRERERPTGRRARHNNGALVPAAHAVEPESIRPAAEACPRKVHSVSQASSSPVFTLITDRDPLGTELPNETQPQAVPSHLPSHVPVWS